MRIQSWFWLVVLVAGTCGAWGQEDGILVPLDETTVRFVAHATTSVGVDFLNTATQAQTAHFELTRPEWDKFADYCYRAVTFKHDANDPDYQHIDQVGMGTVGGIKIWRLIEPQTGPAIVLSAGRKTLADVAGKAVYRYLKALHEVTTQLEPSPSPSP